MFVHEEYMFVDVFDNQQADVKRLFSSQLTFSSFSLVAEEFDPEENLHSTEGQSHM